MTIFFSSNIFSYAFTSDFNKGFYWQSFPVPMKRFVTNANDATLLQTLADEAVVKWESAVGANLWQLDDVVQSSSYSGNYIRWSDNFGAETGYDPNSTLAITTRYNRGTYFEQVVIILNGGLAYLRQNSNDALRKTILHEIGHTLGLDHSTDISAVMYPMLGSTTVLQNDDIQGMTALVHQTQYRQQTGYISPYSASTDSSKKFAACGTVEEINRNGKGGGGSVVNFLSALILGMILAKFAKSKKRSTVKVRY